MTDTQAVRMVPVEPDDEMIRVGAWRAKLHREANPGDTWEESAREVFAVMIAAAPSFSAQDCGCGLGDKCPDPPAATPSVQPDREVIARISAAIADAESGGRYDDRRDDGSRCEVDTDDLRAILSALQPVAQKEEG